METLKANRKRRVRVAFPGGGAGVRLPRLLRPAATVRSPAPGGDWRVYGEALRTAIWPSPSRRTAAWT